MEEMKICVDNIPSFKVHIQKTINYANILLKRISSLKYLSNYSVCYNTNKVRINLNFLTSFELTFSEKSYFRSFSLI